MIPFVISKQGQPIYAEGFDHAGWKALKDAYEVGDLITPCCGAPAVPKTSSNGLAFFAHHVDECTTSPESAWHVSSKDQVVQALARLGIKATLEKRITGISSRATADVYFEHQARRIAVEIQHSYQSLDRYFERQNGYTSAGIESYWLVYAPTFNTLAKSIAKLRIRRDFGGKFPESSFLPFVPELPAVVLTDQGGAPIVSSGSAMQAPLNEWLASVIRNSFRYSDGAWRIV